MYKNYKYASTKKKQMKKLCGVSANLKKIKPSKKVKLTNRIESIEAFSIDIIIRMISVGRVERESGCFILTSEGADI